MAGFLLNVFVLRSLNPHGENWFVALVRPLLANDGAAVVIMPADSSWPTPARRHGARKRPHRENRSGRLGSAKFPSAPKFPARHPPRCRGNGPCFPVWCGQAATERPEDSSSVC